MWAGTPTRSTSSLLQAAEGAWAERAAAKEVRGEGLRGEESMENNKINAIRCPIDILGMVQPSLTKIL